MRYIKPQIEGSEYNNENMPTNENSTNQGGGSQVSEPEIVNPINNQGYTPPIKKNLNLEDVENKLPTGTNSPLENQNSGNSKPKGEPSATTDENKTYVGGGTTPDSQIVINKPKKNYLVFGVIGLVAVFVAYKVFFNKKSQ
jgi:hypothetical protein